VIAPSEERVRQALRVESTMSVKSTVESTVKVGASPRSRKELHDLLKHDFGIFHKGEVVLARYLQKAGSRNLLGEIPAVLHSHHSVPRAVDHEGGRSNCRKYSARVDGEGHLQIGDGALGSAPSRRSRAQHSRNFFSSSARLGAKTLIPTAVPQFASTVRSNVWRFLSVHPQRCLFGPTQTGILHTGPGEGDRVATCLARRCGGVGASHDLRVGRGRGEGDALGAGDCEGPLNLIRSFIAGISGLGWRR
jgi:hypothetical protein